MTERLRIRTYTRDDIDQIVAIVARELPQLPTYEGMVVKPAKLHALLYHNVTNATFLCVVLCDSHNRVHGGGAAVTSPCIFNDDMIATDLFMFVEPEYRALFNVNQLLDAYVAWARARKCTMILATQLSGFKVEKHEVLMRRKGFSFTGNTFVMRTGK